MDSLFIDKIHTYFNEQSKISKGRLLDRILTDFPELKTGTVNVYLSRLKKIGVLKTPSRGVYTLEEKNEYLPNVDIKLKRLFNKIKKEYPFAQFCIWDTKWLNEFMRHQPFKYYTVLELEKDVAESVFYMLKEQDKQVFLEPDTETFELYVANSDDVIILKHLISEAPLLEVDKIVVPTLEKLLVDMIIDTNLYAAQQGEITFIYDNVFDKYTVNKQRMKRYAYRRNRDHEVERFISDYN